MRVYVVLGVVACVMQLQYSWAMEEVGFEQARDFSPFFFSPPPLF